MVSVATLQESFVTYLPHLRRIARSAFRHLEPERRAEAVSNTIALCWKAWHRLGELDKASEPGILKAIVWYSVKQTKAGRRIDWAGKPRDVLSLRSYGKVRFDPWNLEDYVGKETPIPDAVSFRLDVPAFLNTLTERQRSLAMDLAQGMSTTEAAAKYNRSAGAISQFRRRFKVLFDKFFAE
jgi:hypothetical protein